MDTSLPGSQGPTHASPRIDGRTPSHTGRPTTRDRTQRTNRARDREQAMGETGGREVVGRRASRAAHPRTLGVRREETSSVDRSASGGPSRTLGYFGRARRGDARSATSGPSRSPEPTPKDGTRAVADGAWRGGSSDFPKARTEGLFKPLSLKLRLTSHHRGGVGRKGGSSE